MQLNKANGTPFPLVLLDADMPGLNGFEVAERMKAESGLAGRVIIMFGSAGDMADAARFRSFGIDASVTKPLYQGEIKAAILRCFRDINQDRRILPAHEDRARQRPIDGRLVSRR